ARPASRRSAARHRARLDAERVGAPARSTRPHHRDPSLHITARISRADGTTRTAYSSPGAPELPPPALRVPVAARSRIPRRDHDEVRRGRTDLVVAAGASIRLLAGHGPHLEPRRVRP